MTHLTMKTWTSRDGLINRVYFTVDGKDGGFAERRTTIHKLGRATTADLRGMGGTTSTDAYSNNVDTDLIALVREIMEDEAGRQFDDFDFFQMLTICSDNYKARKGHWTAKKVYKDWRGGVEL